VQITDGQSPSARATSAAQSSLGKPGKDLYADSPAAKQRAFNNFRGEASHLSDGQEHAQGENLFRRNDQYTDSTPTKDPHLLSKYDSGKREEWERVHGIRKSETCS
jgi:hypothetical protein